MLFPMKGTVHRAGRFLLMAVVIVGSTTMTAAAAGAGERAGSAPSSTQVATAQVGLPGVTVMELFTSEGCSSCPPAEAALSVLLSRSQASGAPVFALAWHVGYWNDLGWRDPYTLPAATERQRRYASAFSSSLYTPEIVVNGTRTASSAGDLREVSALAEAARGHAAESALTLAVRRDSSSSPLAVRVTARNAPSGSEVFVALVEDGLVGHPNAGENAGRTLHLNAVVRSFATLPAAGGQTHLTVPPGVRLGRSLVVAFVQTDSLAIVGANEIDLDAVGTSNTARSLVSGRVLDHTGRGVGRAQIQACSDTLCVPAATDSSGRFTVNGIPPGTYDVKLFLPKRSAAPVAMLPLEVGSGEDISLPTIEVGI